MCVCCKVLMLNIVIVYAIVSYDACKRSVLQYELSPKSNDVQGRRRRDITRNYVLYAQRHTTGYVGSLIFRFSPKAKLRFPAKLVRHSQSGGGETKQQAERCTSALGYADTIVRRESVRSSILHITWFHSDGIRQSTNKGQYSHSRSNRAREDRDHLNRPKTKHGAAIEKGMHGDRKSCVASSLAFFQLLLLLFVHQFGSLRNW